MGWFKPRHAVLVVVLVLINLATGITEFRLGYRAGYDAGYDVGRVVGTEKTKQAAAEQRDAELSLLRPYVERGLAEAGK